MLKIKSFLKYSAVQLRKVARGTKYPIKIEPKKLPQVSSTFALKFMLKSNKLLPKRLRAFLKFSFNDKIIIMPTKKIPKATKYVIFALLLFVLSCRYFTQGSSSETVLEIPASSNPAIKSTDKMLPNAPIFPNITGKVMKISPTPSFTLPSYSNTKVKIISPAISEIKMPESTINRQLESRFCLLLMCEE